MNSEHIAAQILLRSWPFPRGAGRLIDKFFSKSRFAADVADVNTTDGFRMSVRPNDLIGRHIYLTGEFDRTTVEILCDFSESGDTLCDIGANIGYVSACFLKNVSSSTVISIEPQPAVLDLLGRNLAQFGQRSSIYPIALSDKSGTMPFVINKENNGMSRLAASNEVGSVMVPVVACDEFFNGYAFEKIDLMKIDVEGHESRILEASKQFIKRLRPRAILFEDYQGRSIRTITTTLDEVGYEVFGIKKQLTRVCLLRAFSETSDYVAISRSRPIPPHATEKYRLR
jgi:FkbM family methyltransferase